MFEHVHAAAARNLFVIAAPWYAYRVNNPLPGSTYPHPPFAAAPVGDFYWQFDWKVAGGTCGVCLMRLADMRWVFKSEQ